MDDVCQNNGDIIQNMHNGTFVSIDFECFNPNIWQSMGVVIYDKSGIKETFSSHCEREPPYTKETRSFWKKHHDAYVYNHTLGKGRDVRDEEKRICLFIQQIKRKYTRCYMLSDNPEFDISLLNDILTRNGYTIISHRSSKVYLQTICTWTSRLILKMLGVRQLKMDIIKYDGHDIHHTPIHDCKRILNDYLCTLRTINDYRNMVQYTKAS